MVKTDDLGKLTDIQIAELAKSIGAFTLDYESFSLFGETNPIQNSTDDFTKRYLALVVEKIAGKRVIDLGAGHMQQLHGKVLTKLGASQYVGVDINWGEVKEDALTYLISQNDGSAICMAFGLLNDPIFGDSWSDGCSHQQRRWIRQEYARRLCKQIYRVTYPGGIFFGKGIDERAGDYLTEAGFENIGLHFIPKSMHRLGWERFRFMFQKK